MSLLDNAMETFVMIDKTTAPDGYGGFESVYTEGAEFQAVAVFANSTESRLAAVNGALDRYRITTRRSINLQYHDVLKRSRDNKIFRVTSDGDDNYTPAAATLDMRQVRAEEYVLPT